MADFAKGERVTLRAWGGQLVTAYVLKCRGPFCLVRYRKDYTWAGEDPPAFGSDIKASWRPKWRLIK